MGLGVLYESVIAARRIKFCVPQSAQLTEARNYKVCWIVQYITVTINELNLFQMIVTN